MPTTLKSLDETSLLSPSDLAVFLDVSLSTHERWRCHGEGPHFIKTGRRRIAYRLSTVRRWLEGQERTNTAA
jgi:hypothetical protein